MAMSANTVWEYRATNGNVSNGGGFVWLCLCNAAYKWTLSASGTNEYYCEAAAGGDPSLTKASCSVGGKFALSTEGTMGSLTAGQWDYGDNDSLGYNTIYVRLSDGADPDTKNAFTVALGKGGGTDYSQQNSPQLAVTDGASVGAGAVITSVIGGFTAAMVGNIVNIVSGTNATAGRYEIISRDSANQITLDRNCTTGAGLNIVANIGGADALLTDATLELWIAGNRGFIKNDGVMTLTGSVSIALTGTQANPILLLGYNSTRGDNPTLINRPVIACGASSFALGSYWKIRNLITTSTGAAGLTFGNAGGSIYNCFGINTSATVGRSAMTNNTGGLIYLSEAVSLAGNAISHGGGQSYTIGCYQHDSSIGESVGTADNWSIIGCIIDECASGILSTGGSIGCVVLGNTIYSQNPYASSAGIATSGASSVAWMILNNIITGFATGINWNDADSSNLINYNVLFGNTLDRVVANTMLGIMGNDANVYTDPLLTAPKGTLIDDCEDAWNEYAGTGVTATADSVDFQVGSASAKAACAAGTGVEVVMTEAIPSTNMTAYRGIRCHVWSDVALAAGDWQLLLDDTANCASPIKTLNLPAMAAGTKYKVYLDGGDMSGCTAIISIGLKQAVDKGVMNFHIDEVRAANPDLTVQAGSPVLDAGMQIGANQGVVGDYKVNIGVDQDDNTAAGGGGWFAGE